MSHADHVKAAQSGRVANVIERRRDNQRRSGSPRRSRPRYESQAAALREWGF